MKNAYPELPELPFQQTSVGMPDVIAYLKSMPAPAGVDPALFAAMKCAAYVMFRNESGNGQHGVNNNYSGVHGDSGRWDPKFDGLFAGTVTRTENQTNRVRIFMAFKSWQGSVDFLIDRVRSRGLHIGGTTHLVLKMVIASVEDLARAYFKEWVRGSATAEPDDATKGNFVSMYNQALTRVT